MSNINEANYPEFGSNGASHLDEITCQLFIDGQLDQAQSQSFEVHVAGCSDCRALVRVLQQESLLLSAALLETEEPFPTRLRVPPWEHSHVRTPHPASPRPARQFASGSHWTNWAPWAWALGFFIAAAACFTAWTDILAALGLSIRSDRNSKQQPGATRTDDNRLLGRMAKYVGQTRVRRIRIDWSFNDRRRRDPVARTLAQSGHRRRGTRRRCCGPGPGHARGRRGNPQGSDINVPPGETINNDLIAAGQSVRIDGTINGDLITFSQDVTVNGRVTGDIIAFGDMIQIDGPVGGNIRCFCNTLTLNNTIQKNLTAFAAHVQVNPEAVIMVESSPSPPVSTPTEKWAAICSSSFRIPPSTARSAATFACAEVNSQ